MDGSVSGVQFGRGKVAGNDIRDLGKVQVMQGWWSMLRT